MLDLLLQIDPKTKSAAIDTATAALTTPEVQEFSILGLLMKGGFFVIPILVLSIVAIYIFIERYIAIRKARKFDENFMTNLKNHMLGGDIASAEALCRSTNTPIARILEKGIRRLGKPLKNIETSIENTAKLELYNLEKRLAALATIAGAAPMIGFLGTVTGMIRAFFNIANSGSNVNPSLLAGGIYEALITTALGLTVGIIAFIGYNILVSMIDRVIYRMQAVSIEFMDLLQEPA